MDCYSAESEFIESLDFLSPPVKRIHNSRDAFASAYNTDANNVHLLRGLRNKFARRGPSSPKNITRPVKPTADSSTSLILKKTSERQILEHYSIVSYTSLHPEQDTSSVHELDRNQNNSEKPLIKVTVIPKTDHIQTAKLLRRRRYAPKRVQSTSSNHENSVQTKNVYLIVAGRRREKIYEIKTTGSAKLSTDHDSYTKDDEIPIKELSNFKHLIQSLNMDRKKKKEKKETVENLEVPPAQDSIDWQGYPDCQNCICMKDNQSTESPQKSRVRIFGQFGISDEDKYVLRYGASVNDKQVLSDVAQLTREFSPIIATTSYGTADIQSAQQKDSCIQADYNYDLDVEKPPISDEVPSKESQGTQVNFNVQVAMTKPRGTTFSDKKIQCSCCAVPKKSEHNPLKVCQSPLVIISVYPKPSPEDLLKSVPSNFSDISQNQSPGKMSTYTSNQILKTDKTAKKSSEQTKRTYKSPIISRTPSPVKKVSKSKLLDDMPVKLSVNERRSPDRQKALKAIKEKIQEKDRLKLENSARKMPSRLNETFATQVSKNLQNLTVSNATQVSKKNQRLYTASDATQVSNRNKQLYTASNGTQVSAKKRQDFTVSGTQYSDGPQSLSGSYATKGEDDTADSIDDAVHVKQTKNVAISKHPQIKTSPISPRTTLVSNATQVPKVPQFFASNATQISQSDAFMVSNSTQVSKNNQNFIASRLAKNQETYTAPVQVIQNQQTSRLIPKAKAETGTNTDHARAKKALVDSYTKKLTEQMIQKEYLPANYVNSKVTINIDADKEYYDVLFNQDKLSTDLTIRKKLKESPDVNENLYPVSFDNLYTPDSVLQKTAVFIPGNKVKPTKFDSNILSNNHSGDESPLGKHVSRLTIRDSLEISHRREDKSMNNNNIKNTQTCFTAQFTEPVPDETEVLAPIKHFTGDDCSICNPIERDKQIRELLGVDKKKPSIAKTRQAQSCKTDAGIPYQYIFRKECKKSQVTEINFEFQKLCPCFTRRHLKENPSVSVQCQDCVNKPREALKNSKFDSVITDATCTYAHDKEPPKPSRNDSPAIYQQLILNRNIQVFLQVDQFSKQKPIVLSRQQYNKVKKTIQKTICLTKNSSHDKRKPLLSRLRDRSQVSVGIVRTKKPKDPKSLQERAAQTDTIPKETDKKKNVIKAKPPKEKPRPKPEPKKVNKDSRELKEAREREAREAARKAREAREARKAREAEEKKIRKRKLTEHLDIRSVDHISEIMSFDKICEDFSSSSEDKKCLDYCPAPCSEDYSEVKVKEPSIAPEPEGCQAKSCLERPCEGECGRKCVDEDKLPRFRAAKLNDDEEHAEKEVKTFVLFNSDNVQDPVIPEPKEPDYDGHNRKTMSSVEVRYASVAYMKQVAYSSTDVGAPSDSSIAHVNSFHTIFRGHRKSATPNLGTSAYSLYSEDVLNSENKSAKYIMEPRDSKPKKPFLRRLMSCLVMRSTRDSDLKLPIGPAPEPPSVNSSIDSYHISTSLGAVEVSSSIYDTSASFYSNHTILPVNSKIKRGFFSSVRGFLTNRKS
ncbi:hypothetical protein B5X24_HaOG207442 [Helicoverpa armigera]|nr:hypothetical protein B5X24_HaOG207442 [Helicoverpa armigera]